MPPQTVVTELKAVVRGSGLPIGNWWRGVLTDRLVRWGVEAYYGDQPDERADR